MWKASGLTRMLWQDWCSTVPLIAVIFLFMTGHTLPAGAVLGVMFGIPLVIIMLKEPLARMVKKECPVIEGSKGMYFCTELFLNSSKSC